MIRMSDEKEEPMPPQGEPSGTEQGVWRPVVGDGCETSTSQWTVFSGAVAPMGYTTLPDQLRLTLAMNAYVASDPAVPPMSFAESIDRLNRNIDAVNEAVRAFGAAFLPKRQKKRRGRKYKGMPR